ncbi:serine protease 1-like isoform X2 [Anastrepha obliqua]|uniref:serine protease 1-like isoform X2 n=1 Tax=Anastrepha obliqua TaxID=95512 RepID=UPI0024097903|nr:serine protease 1-like isoform X2 [Anastrepha obliqua]XP_054734900.1 serine protease 1-like isoform X2 [Anastrepha obliqua]
MKLLSIFALCIAGAAHAFNGRITNGEKATAGQFPYQVGLLLKSNAVSSAWCGGSLISNTYVLTAAHCIDSIPEITVYLGATERTSPEFTHTVTKADVIIHSSWNRRTLRNDISLIKIPYTPYTSKISAVQLPSIANSYSTYIGERVVASGWGRTSDSSNSVTKHLMFATLEVFSNSLCAKSYGSSFVRSSIICVATPSGQSTCNGDSGGPLVLESSMIQVGLTSFGASIGCELGYPITFTRLTKYLKWIKEHTGVSY